MIIWFIVSLIVKLVKEIAAFYHFFDIILRKHYFFITYTKFDTKAQFPGQFDHC